MRDAVPLTPPNVLKSNLPLPQRSAEFIEERRKSIRRILSGQDSRLLLIIGPCSIHDKEAAIEFAKRLQELEKNVSDLFLIVMRVYFEKPRTTLGWKGYLYDPHLDGSHDIEAGLQSTRELLLELTELGVATAAEILDPSSAQYFGDLLAWSCIGARTTTSPIHRQVASGLPMPVAFKNSLDGDIRHAVMGAQSAVVPHVYIGMNEEGRISLVRSTGNEDAHITLRGGEKTTNFDTESVQKALSMLRKVNLPERLLIDCSHGNSQREYQQQCTVFEQVMAQIQNGCKEIRGLILESHLNAGNQPHHQGINQLRYAVSLTDPCLDWETTDKLIRQAHAQLSSTLLIQK